MLERRDAAGRAGVLRREEIDVARFLCQAFEAHGAALAPAAPRIALLLAHFHGRQAEARVERHQPHEARDAADGFGGRVLLQVDQRAQLALPCFLALEPRRHVRQAVLRPLRGGIALLLRFAHQAQQAGRLRGDQVVAGRVCLLHQQCQLGFAFAQLR